MSKASELILQLTKAISTKEKILLEVCQKATLLSVYWGGKKIGSFSIYTDTLELFLKRIIKAEFIISKYSTMTRSGKAYLIGQLEENLLNFFERK